MKYIFKTLSLIRNYNQKQQVLNLLFKQLKLITNEKKLFNSKSSAFVWPY